MTPNATYRRLPGARRGLLRKATLWLAYDHILAVDSRRFTEQYKRYYFKDIQAIQLTEMGTAGRAIELVLVIVVLLVAFIAWRLQSVRTAMAAGVLLLGYLSEKSHGTRCSCHLITAVSQDRLPSLTRMRTSLKALRVIQPLVEQAQRQPVS